MVTVRKKTVNAYPCLCVLGTYLLNLVDHGSTGLKLCSHRLEAQDFFRQSRGEMKGQEEPSIITRRATNITC